MEITEIIKQKEIIENHKTGYENLIDKVTLEIEEFVKKNTSDSTL